MLQTVTLASVILYKFYDFILKLYKIVILYKVFFDVDPDYLGTQLFHLHGIHYVQVSKI